MTHLNSGPFALQFSSHIHQATQVTGEQQLRASAYNMGRLLRNNFVGNIRILDAKRAAKTAADIGVFHLFQRQPVDLFEQLSWLGLNAIEQGRELRVVRVAEDGPAQAAGVRAGDRIVSLDGQPVATLDALWTRLWAGGGPERTIRLDIQRGNERLTFEVRSVDRAANLRRATGV